MTIDEFVDEMADRIDSLAPRSRAATFWILGFALARPLNPPEEWAAWFSDARAVGRRYVVTGEVGERAQEVWAGAKAPTGDQATQLLNSAILCLSTPVGIALDPSLRVGSWVEHALFPSIQRASLDLFGDVAFPGDDDELDEVFEQPVVQATVDYCRNLVGGLVDTQAPSDAELERLLEGSEVLGHDV